MFNWNGVRLNNIDDVVRLATKNKSLMEKMKRSEPYNNKEDCDLLELLCCRLFDLVVSFYQTVQVDLVDLHTHTYTPADVSESRTKGHRTKGQTKQAFSIHKPSYKFVLIFPSLKHEFMYVCFHEVNERFNSLTSKMPLLLLLYATETSNKEWVHI